MTGNDREGERKKGKKEGTATTEWHHLLPRVVTTIRWDGCLVGIYSLLVFLHFLLNCPSKRVLKLLEAKF